MKRTLVGLLLSISAVAAADPSVSVKPDAVHPGDAVLVTVTGTSTTPKGTGGGKTALHFYASPGGYQAVVAVPLETTGDSFAITVAGKPVAVHVDATKFPETSVIVEDEMANPPKADRDRIDADNHAILVALAKDEGEPRFTRPFKRPPGEVNSTFGEWRTFNDGHRSQHLGLDLFAREGSKVHAINAGLVTLVRDTFLAGNVVVVTHGAGIASAYYHLSKVSVAEGDVLAAGAEVGLAGHTGRTTGPHLHLSVRVPGGFVDPAEFLKLDIKARGPTTAAR